ncbi:MAG TPA: Slp family lipoprotein [Nitrospira sp.]|jgi:hypothetical protein|nr:Slp family lipoprotein [Nitrospira sp.]MBS0172780.1 Slp family lipoprotein [Nitrospira sp.]MBS0177315.1 Slp family lipoprotein [Nitrospira sp.]MBX3337267.1 Slp family lipoprotein [Nitrospira sp.]MCW5781595.1 Slp family lipoprotein [Nitrospira sp.]
MMVMAPVFHWWRSAGCVIGLMVLLSGCGNMPREYQRMAEPGVTLTALTANPESYRGKVVLMGGTMVDEARSDHSVWLRMKNRPLDEDDIPREPIETDGPEAGHFWVQISTRQLPAGYRAWARMSLAGRVTGKVKLGHEPVLRLLYARHWGLDAIDKEAFREFDPNYDVVVPESIGVEIDVGSDGTQ